MATPFEKIYERAVFKFADYEFLRQEPASRQDILEQFLISAKSDFADICKSNLNNCDFTTKQFNEDLDDMTIEILSLGIAYKWISFKTMDSRLLKNVLNGPDYRHYSPAQLLKTVKDLRSEIYREWRSKMNEYSYNNADIGSLKA